MGSKKPSRPDSVGQFDALTADWMVGNGLIEAYKPRGVKPLAKYEQPDILNRLRQRKVLIPGGRQAHSLEEFIEGLSGPYNLVHDLPLEFYRLGRSMAEYFSARDDALQKESLLRKRDYLLSLKDKMSEERFKSVYVSFGDVDTDEGEGELDVPAVKLPVALSNYFMKERGLFCLGLFSRYGPSKSSIQSGRPLGKHDLYVVSWTNKEFAIDIARQVSSVAAAKVTALYCEKGRKGCNDFRSLGSYRVG